MNAANTLPSSPNSSAGALPRTPRGLTKEQELGNAAKYLQDSGFQAVVQGDFVEVQAPYLLIRGGQANELRHETRTLHSLRAAIRFVQAHE